MQKKKHQSATLKISSLQGFKGTNSIWQAKTNVEWTKILALCSLIVAMRPRTVDVSNKTKKKNDKGIDIGNWRFGDMLKDLKPNRMEALKRVAADFCGRT
jgi:Ca-activated chloride channel family protein